MLDASTISLSLRPAVTCLSSAGSPWACVRANRMAGVEPNRIAIFDARRFPFAVEVVSALPNERRRGLRECWLTRLQLARGLGTWAALHDSFRDAVIDGDGAGTRA
jgi:hypothetical protein